MAVARAFMAKAELLLLDEPLGALDIKVRTVLRYELRKIVKDLKLTALHVTHDQEEAMSISDRVVVMKRGQIVESGAPMDLYMYPKNIFTANFVGEANFLKGTITNIAKRGTQIEVNGAYLLTKKQEKRVGDLVIIAFRPEFASIDVHNKGKKKLAGEVVKVIYSGSIIRVIIQLEGGETVVVKKTVGAKRPEYGVGDKVVIGITPKNVLVYKYPQGGLNKELALE
jgi:ABC-type Fe3+/spermidine/putrescine transport system ATPase subunit